MIDKNKTYRTRDGREVRIYATDGGAPYPVHGAIRLGDDNWELVAWRNDGRLSGYSHNVSPDDLIEVKPRIKREVWVNVYPGGVNASSTKEYADKIAAATRLACVKVTIDVEEGEGL